MQEVVARRYGQSEHLARPDLILIDGGLGQLAAAMEGLKRAGHHGQAIIGLAKARDEKEERIFLPGRKNPIVLRPTAPATHLVQRIRDEAHRFALGYHRKLRGKALLTSQLDQIAGIGAIKRNRLLNQFGSLDRLAEASDEALHEAGLNDETVRSLRKTLGSSPA
jgi:excinuclease ABC subunit C